MSSLPTKFDHNHNSLSVFPRAYRVPSPSTHVSLAKSSLKEFENGPQKSGCDGESLLGDQEVNDGHTKYDQIFDNFVHFEDTNDDQQTMRKHNLPDLRIDKDVDRLTCAFEMELIAATPMSAIGQLNCPPWPLEALGIRRASCDREDFDHLSCGATDCGYGSCNPPTPGEYVFSPLPEDPMSSVASNPASASPTLMSTHSGSPISTLELDSLILGWTPGSPNVEKSPNQMALEPIFTHFNLGGLPSPDDTPTEDDCFASSFPLFEARGESPAPKPTTPLAKKSRTDSCITDAPKKRSRKRDVEDANTKKRRKS